MDSVLPEQPGSNAMHLSEPSSVLCVEDQGYKAVDAAEFF